MHPVLVELDLPLIGKLPIHAFGTFLVLGFLAGAFFARARAKRRLRADPEQVFNVCFALLFIGLAGARFLHAFVDYDAFSGEPMKIFKVWQGGFAFYGGLFACLVWLAWYVPRHDELKGWAFVDVLALAACLAIFVGRWGSFLSGENYGEPAPGLPWAVTFPAKGGQAPIGEPLHPTQLYHSLHGLLAFAVLMLYQRRSPHPGRTAGLFLMLYAIGRGVIEIWRGDDASRGMVVEDVLSLHQVLSLPVFFVGLALFLSRRPADRW